MFHLSVNARRDNRLEIIERNSREAVCCNIDLRVFMKSKKVLSKATFVNLA